VVGVAHGANALGDLLALSGETVVFLASRFHCLFNLLQARGPFWRAPRAALFRLVVGRVERFLPPLERLFRLGGGLFGRSLFDGQWG
jgi:hypothetical protein